MGLEEVGGAVQVRFRRTPVSLGRVEVELRDETVIRRQRAKIQRHNLELVFAQL